MDFLTVEDIRSLGELPVVALAIVVTARVIRDIAVQIIKMQEKRNEKVQDALASITDVNKELVRVIRAQGLKFENQTLVMDTIDHRTKNIKTIADETKAIIEETNDNIDQRLSQFTEQLQIQFRMLSDTVLLHNEQAEDRAKINNEKITECGISIIKRVEDLFNDLKLPEFKEAQKPSDEPRESTDKEAVGIQVLPEGKPTG